MVCLVLPLFQHEFSLLHTKDWPYLIENCVHEEVAYLPWSPLAAGALTGKYLGGARPAGSRWTYSQRNGIFRDTPLVDKAVTAYIEAAKSMASLPLSWPWRGVIRWMVSVQRLLVRRL